jgi:hypothetical protein
MPSAISITVTATGVRLDTYPTATIELNMGGISLLNLSDRTATYTNSFKLPNTPTNAQQLSFAGSVSVRVNPSIEVTIQKGLFQKKAVLKVVSFDSDYSCSVSYSGLYDQLKVLKLEDLFSINPYLSGYSTKESLITAIFSNDLFCPLFIKTSTLSLDDARIFISIEQIINQIVTVLGYNVEIDAAFSFQNDFIYLKDSGIGISGTTGDGYSAIIGGTSTSEILVADILKAICQTYLADFQIDDLSKIIKFSSVSTLLLNSGVEINSFKTYSKLFVDTYGEVNRINYTLESSLPLNFAGDLFTSNGLGDKELLKIAAYVPKRYLISGHYLFDTETDTADKIIFGTRSPVDYSRTYSYTYVFNGSVLTASQTVDSNDMVIISLSGVYSTILNPILTQPIIIDATCILNSLTANEIINTRVIKSLQLGGRYWVDSMAHDLTTGNTKMKLIKLK